MNVPQSFIFIIDPDRAARLRVKANVQPGMNSGKLASEHADLTWTYTPSNSILTVNVVKLHGLALWASYDQVNSSLTEQMNNI